MSSELLVLPINEYVSAHDISFYQEHGWWVSKKTLPDYLIDDLLYSATRYTAGERDFIFSEQINSILGKTGPESVIQGDYLSLQMESAFNFIRQPVLPQIAAFLSKAKQIRLFHDQLIVKIPSVTSNNTAIGWHTDKAYWKSCSSENMLTAWVALHDMSLDMGPLSVWDKSHIWRFEDDLQTVGFKDLRLIERHFKEQGFDPKIQVLELKKGQFSFHHCRLIHGSQPNFSSSTRFGYAIHYQDNTNSHVNRFDKKYFHINDKLCRTDGRGAPDYTDPDICPLLWSFF